MAEVALVVDLEVLTFKFIVVQIGQLTIDVLKCASLFRPILRFCSDVLKVQALLVVASKCIRSQSLAFNWAPRELTVFLPDFEFLTTM